MVIRTTLRKWGNSYGVVIPKDAALKEGIDENDEVDVTIKKTVDIRSLFGKYKFEDVQRVKDELREGWG
jgi:antitoxin component of MazEF toxin-antitoxin module